MKYSLVCPSCGSAYPGGQPVWCCNCGSYLDLDFFPALDRENMPQGDNFWRYSQITLEKPQKANYFNEGFTPMVKMVYSGIDFFAKMDFLLPTGSFKDRGAAVMIGKCKELGIEEIVEDSSGNAACAVAAYCRRAGIKANIYMPAGNSTGKSIQAGAYGAILHRVKGSRTDCANAALVAAGKSYYAAHAWNPFFLHGTKTIIYEISEQMQWKIPDYIFIPVGSGTMLLGIYLGLKELKNAGIIDRFPKLVAVQSNRCSPLKNYIEGIETIVPDKPSIAEGIAIQKPVRLKQIIEAVTVSKGDFVAVDDSDIVEALKASALQGVYIEPTSASAIAALSQYKGKITKKEVVVVPLTGSGLKTSATISSLLN